MKYNSLLKIAFCSAILLLLVILLDKLLDGGTVVFENIPNFAVSGLIFFNNNSVEIATVFLFVMAISVVVGAIQYIKKYGKGEAV